MIYTRRKVYLREKIMAIRVRLRTFLFLLISLFLSSILVIAEDDDEPPAPELLYRDGDSLILVNGYTGETTEILSDLAERDTFTWSPDGRYLLAFLQDGDSYQYCINLYEVDLREWLYPEAISCGVNEAEFSSDGTTIIFSSSDETTAILWRFLLEDESKQELYRTSDDRPNSVGISSITWSPTEKYLTFEPFYWIMGGTLNFFVVMDAETFTYVELSAPNSYYASYYPIWSEDDEWFLIILKEEYVYSGTLPSTNHRGDVYLVSSQTGEQSRLTYSPSLYKSNVNWTETGEIAFTEIIEETHVYTIEEAQNIAVVPDEEIVMPEEIDPEVYWGSGSDLIMSPDPNIGAKVYSEGSEETGYNHEIRIRNIFGSYEEYIAISLSDSYKVYGWRPSDYPYPIG
jgi:dipeptidyl aminopeptidase/acylaminoacyl peptidase